MRRSRGMVDPRMALLRLVREFFAVTVADLYRWPDIKIADAELHPERMANRDGLLPERADGKFVERVRAIFEPYELRVESSVVSPPLGNVTLISSVPGAAPYVQGTLDQSTWQQVETYLRQHHEEPRNVRSQ